MDNLITNNEVWSIRDAQLKEQNGKAVVLVSGLSVGSSSSNPLQFQLLIDHITGHLGDEKVYSSFLSTFSC